MWSDRIPIDFCDEQIKAIDYLVEGEVGETRPEVIRRALERLDKAVRRSREDEEFADSYRQQPDTGLEAWVWTEDGHLVPESVAIDEGIPIGSGPPRDQPGCGKA